MKIHKLLLPLVLFSLLCNVSYAQSKDVGTISGILQLNDENKSDTRMRYWRTGPSGATVMLIDSKSDTLYSKTLDGRFGFKKVAAGKAKLYLSYLGYESKTEEVEVKVNESSFHVIALDIANKKLDDVTVKARVPHVTQSGDTLIYNPLAVKTLDGDMVEDALKQMPGVEIENDKITVMGQDIDKVKVDGKMLFGSDNMAALKNLLASDVSKIKAYEETNVESIRKNIKSDQKQRVLNIETKSKLISAITGDVLLAGGMDVSKGDDGKRQPRYGLGANLNYFSEPFIVTLNVMTNNVGFNSIRMTEMLMSMGMMGDNISGYSETNDAKLNIEKKWEIKKAAKDTSVKADAFERRLTGSYSFSENRRKSKNSSIKTYLKIDEINFDTTKTSSRSKSHTFNVNLLDNYNLYNIVTRASIGQNNNNTYSGKQDIINGAQARRSQKNKTSQSDSWSIGQYGMWYFKDFLINIDYNFSENDGYGWEVDTLASVQDIDKIYLYNTSYGFSRSADAGINKTFKLINKDKEGLYLGVGYDFAYNNSQSKYIVIDKYTEQIEQGRTSDYITNENSHKLHANIAYRKNDKFDFNFMVSGKSAGMNRDELLPLDYIYDKRFNSVNPSVRLMLGKSMGDNVSFNYSSYSIAPSVNQLRDQLDYSDNRMLSVGNPNLKQGQDHSFNIGYTTLNPVKGNQTYVRMSFNVNANAILARVTHFEKDTTLAQWDYQALAGSRLQTFENIGGGRSAYVGAGHSMYAAIIKAKLRFDLKFNYSSTPSYIDQVLDKKKSYNPYFTFRYDSNFSRKYNINLTSTSGYAYSVTGLAVPNENFTQILSIGFKSDVTKWLNINASYRFNNYITLTSIGSNITNHGLNMSAGVKLFKRRCDLSINGFDLLNNTSSFTSSVEQDYIKESWSYNFGRYVMFSVSYKINSTKSQNKGRGSGGMYSPWF